MSQHNHMLIQDNPSHKQRIETLAFHIKGQMILPGDPSYEAERKVWNAAFDRRPALIVRGTDVEDVKATVNFAREQELPLSIRSGGHSIPGYGTNDGGVILDLSLMKDISIDPTRRTARLEPGLTSKEVASALQPYDLALTFGDTGSVGVGGILLAGGIGWMVRKYGLALDQVRAIELVTADGRLLRTSAEENAELFWGLRGAGGNFGVVTAFEVDLHPGGTVLGGMVYFEATDVERMTQEFVSLAAQAPEELTVDVFLMLAPPAPFIPVEKQGKLAFVVRMCYVGEISEGVRVAAPFRQLADPIVDQISAIPYADIFAFNEIGEVRTWQHHGGTQFVKSTSPEFLQALVQSTQKVMSPNTIVNLRMLGGAMNRVAQDATAFAHRDKEALVMVTHFGEVSDDSALLEAKTSRIMQAIAPYASGAYIGFQSEKGEQGVREIYPPATYARLAALKRQYDPGNLFHMNQNIVPATDKEARFH